VVDFVRQNGMTVIGGTRDGMDVQVRASVANIESTFHLTLRTYQHPTEDRTFYATDSEPVANLKVSLWHISGLDNYATPKPRFSKRSDAIARGVTAEEKIASNATTGSGPSASYLGSDMRAACYGGSNLNTYLRNAGQTNSVPVTLLSVDGTSTVCNYSSSSSCDDTEQILDITRSWAWLLV
jgi:hypothetical protein